MSSILSKVSEILRFPVSSGDEKAADHRDVNIRRLEKQLAESVAYTQDLSARLSERDRLLSERTMELSAAQAFLTRVDAVSEAEVVGMVENLNALISSASGALSATWDEREPVPGTLVEEPDLKQIRDYFGNPMFERIAARNPVAVTLAVETYLIHFVEQVTSGWGCGDAAETLGEIYEKISTKEGQTIASRWRTLTKRYAPHQEPPQGEEIIGDLARILMITRSFSDLPEAVESVGSSAGTEVEEIIEATLRLDDVIKTKIASSDMSVYVVSPGASFARDTMADEFGEDGTREEEEGGEHRIVAGTIEIGLLQRVGDVRKVLRNQK